MHKAWTDGVLRFSYTVPEDLEHVSTMLAKESVCEHVYFGPNSAEETENYFMPLITPMQAALRGNQLPENHIFSIRESVGKAFVGECALLPVMFGAGNYTIGYQLDDVYWRRGYGTRACEFVVWYGFTQLAARRLSGDTMSSNAGSARIMEKCGFGHEGVRRGYYMNGQRPGDDVLFGLLRETCPLDLEEMTLRFLPTT